MEPSSDCTAAVVIAADSVAAQAASTSSTAVRTHRASAAAARRRRLDACWRARLRTRPTYVLCLTHTAVPDVRGAMPTYQYPMCALPAAHWPAKHPGQPTRPHACDV
jgi:hypothetical protein